VQVRRQGRLHHALRRGRFAARISLVHQRPFLVVEEVAGDERAARAMKFCCILLLSGCVSFQAVSATARLGEQVGAYERALAPLGSWCRLSAATVAQPEAECGKLEADAQIFRKIPVQLAAYAEALRRMAEDAGAPCFSADAAALVRPVLPAHAE